MIKNRWQLIPMTIIILLLISEAIWYAPYTRPKGGSLRIQGVTVDETGNVIMNLQLSTDLPLDATIVVTPVTEAPKDLPVYIFYDKDYSPVGTSWIFNQMLWEHVKTEFQLRSYSAKVKLANADELEGLLSAKSPAILIIASGAFPSNLLSWEKNLVKPWIDSGGILIWFGGVPGYHIAQKGQSEEEIKRDLPQHLYEEGPKRLGIEGFFDFMAKEEQSTVAEFDSSLSGMLETRYNLIEKAPLLQKVIGVNGLALGKIGGQLENLKSSISMIPIRMGKILIFGCFLRSGLVLNGPELSARDIAQILCSGVLESSSISNIWYRRYQLSQGETRVDTLTIHIELIKTGIVIYGYASQESSSLLFHREFILPKAGK